MKARFSSTSTPSWRRDWVVATCAWLSAAVVCALIACLLGDLLRGGFGQIDLALLTAQPRDAGRAGGLRPILVSTLIILTVCVVVATPLAVGTAVALTEFASQSRRWARWVSRSIDALTAVPSIVFGLFGNAFFCHILGLGFSLLSGGLTLACMVLPLLIRTTEAGLRQVPVSQRQAATALGLSRTTMLRRLLLPAAMPSIAVGLILGIGRAIAETAALLFTSGYVDRMPRSLFDSGRTLSVHIYDLAMNVPGGDARAYATALILVALLIVGNAITLLSTRSLLTPHEDAS